jgi:transposase
LKRLGEDASEILEYVRERIKVIRQVRPKLACAGCDRIVQAAAPSRPIARSAQSIARELRASIREEIYRKRAEQTN